MKARRGFTLVELLLAVTLSALVATSAFAAFNLFAEADSRAIEHTERAVDVGRALDLLRRDALNATAIDVQPQRWTLSLPGGTSVVYAVPTGGSELHRFVSADLLGLLTTVQTLLLGPAVTPTYSARGHLRDGSYRASALFQGALAIRAATLTSPRNGDVIGMHVAIDHRTTAGVMTSSCTALSLPLAEQHSKP